MRSRRQRRAARRVVAAGLVLAATLLQPALPARAGTIELTYARLCRKTFTVQGRTYALKRMGLVLQCADKLLRCELLHEIDGEDPTACRASVTDACTKRLGAQPDSALSKAALRFDQKTGGICETPAFSYIDVLSTGPGGLWFGNDAACASEVDLPTFFACLRDETDARTDALISTLKPRTGLLFDNAGLGAAFPHLVRPPLVAQPVAATAAGSGTLVDPGTLVVAVGSALRFTGDPTTLPCAPSSNNGRVTITVGSGPTAERHQLREPYGAAEVAIFGPWVAPGAMPYTIDLKDGTCDGTVSGTVSIP